VPSANATFDPRKGAITIAPMMMATLAYYRPNATTMVDDTAITR